MHSMQTLSFAVVRSRYLLCSDSCNTCLNKFDEMSDDGNGSLEEALTQASRFQMRLDDALTWAHLSEERSIENWNQCRFCGVWGRYVDYSDAHGCQLYLQMDTTRRRRKLWYHYACERCRDYNHPRMIERGLCKAYPELSPEIVHLIFQYWEGVRGFSFAVNFQGYDRSKVWYSCQQFEVCSHEKLFQAHV